MWQNLPKKKEDVPQNKQKKKNDVGLSLHSTRR